MSENSKDIRSASYLWWSRIVAIILAIILLLMWWFGYGPNRANCCGAGAPAVAAAPAAVAVAPAPAPAAAAVAPAPTVAAAAGAGCADALKLAVSFSTGSAVLSAEGKKSLDGMVDCIKAKAVNVIGHTDNVGGDTLNLALSQKRANAVVAYLAGKGVPAANMAARGEGEAKPVADNATAAGRATNRRMEIVNQ